jgi:alanine dehydrogenase
MHDVLFVSSEDVTELATQEEFNEAVREGYRQRGEGAPTETRTSLKSEDPPGLLNSYVAILPDMGIMGGYIYSAGFSDGDARFATPLFDSETGRMLAILDGASMNPFKTGAVGAVGIDALARSDVDTLALIGSGAQARGQLLATVTVRDFDAVRVFSPTREHREEFADEIDERLAADVAAVESGGEAVSGSDVVITATTAREPVFDADDLDPGTHVNAIGQYDPDKREIDTQTLVEATYVPDLRERTLQDSGEFLIPLRNGDVTEDHIHAELGEVIAGSAPGRTSDDEITLFDSGGTAIETVASAALLYRRAEEKGLGETFPFSQASEVYTGKRRDSTEELS